MSKIESNVPSLEVFLGPHGVDEGDGSIVHAMEQVDGIGGDEIKYGVEHKRAVLGEVLSRPVGGMISLNARAPINLSISPTVYCLELIHSR